MCTTPRKKTQPKQQQPVVEAKNENNEPKKKTTTLPSSHKNDDKSTSSKSNGADNGKLKKTIYVKSAQAKKLTGKRGRKKKELMNKSGHRPEGREENQTIYTGTHDNELTRTWFKQLDDGERQRVLNYLNSDGVRIHRDLCELALRSPAKWAILPLQDLLGKGRRMNTPGTTHGNWSWRVSEDMLTTGIQDVLREMTERNGR